MGHDNRAYAVPFTANARRSATSCLLTFDASIQLVQTLFFDRGSIAWQGVSNSTKIFHGYGPSFRSIGAPSFTLRARHFSEIAPTERNGNPARETERNGNPARERLRSDTEFIQWNEFVRHQSDDCIMRVGIDDLERLLKGAE